MTRLELFKGLYSQAVDQGFSDPLRKFAPDSTQGTYEEWMLTSGYYKALFLNMIFTECLERYFLSKEISLREEGEEMAAYIRRIVSQNIEPLAFYQGPYEQSLKPAEEAPQG